MTMSRREAHDNAEWANAAWRETSMEEVQMRLRALDQNVRATVGLPDRPDAEQIQAWIAANPPTVPIPEPAPEDTLQLPVVQLPHINTVMDPIKPLPEPEPVRAKRTPDLAPADPAPTPEATPTHAEPEPPPVPTPTLPDPPAAMGDEKTLEEAHRATTALSDQVDELREQAERATQIVTDLRESHLAMVAARRGYEYEVRALYGANAEAVLQRTPIDLLPTAQQEIADMLRRDPARIAPLDPKWIPRFERAALVTERAAAAKAASADYDEWYLAKLKYDRVCTGAISHYRLPPNASFQEVQYAAEKAQHIAVQQMQEMRNRLVTQELPAFRRNIQKHYEALSPENRAEFLRAHPDWARLVASTGRNAIRTIEGHSRGWSR